MQELITNHNLLRITCTSDPQALNNVLDAQHGDVIIVPSARVRARVFNDFVEGGVVRLPVILTQQVFIKWLALRLGKAIIPVDDVLSSILFQSESRVQSTYAQYLRWLHEGHSLRRIFEQTDDPIAPQIMRNLGDTLRDYQRLKGAWVDTAELPEHILQQLSELDAKPLNIFVLETHGLTLSDSKIFQALANIGWHITVQFAQLSEHNNVALRRTRSDAMLLVGSGWGIREETTPHSVTLIPSTSHSIRSAVIEAVSKIKYAILHEKAEPQTICVVIPDGSALRNPFIELCIAAKVPIAYSDTTPFTHTSLISALFSVTQLVLHNWTRKDFERVVRTKSIVANQQVVHQVLATMYEKKVLGAHGAGTLLRDIRQSIAPQLIQQIEFVFQWDIPTTQLLPTQEFVAWVRKISSAVNTNEQHLEELEFCLNAYLQLEEHIQAPTKTFETHVQQFFTVLTQRNVYSTSAHPGGVDIVASTQLRGGEYHSVYVLGATEGVFPKAVNDELDEILVSGLAESKQYQALQDIVNACKVGGTIYWHWNTHDENGPTTTSSFLEILRSFNITITDAALPIQADILFIPGRKLASNVLQEIYYAKQGGNVYPEQESTEQYLASIRTRELSASRLDAIATCPFRFFGERVLYLGDTTTDDYAQTSLERGSEFHEILDEFYRGFQSETRNISTLEGILQQRVLLDPAKFHEYYQKLESIYKKRRAATDTTWIFAAREDMMMLGTAQRAGLLRVWLTRELRDQQEMGFAPTLLEFRAHVELQEGIDGKTERMVMQIDRVDTRFENGILEAIIIDYKSTVNSFKTIPQLVQGRATQMPLYVVGLQQWFTENNIPAVVTQAHYIAMGKHLLDGNLDKISKKGLRSNFMPSGSRTSIKNYSTAIDEAKDLVSQMGVLVQRIRNANFAVEPSDEACSYCTLTNLCRKHHWGIIDEKTNPGTIAVDMSAI